MTNSEASANRRRGFLFLFLVIAVETGAQLLLKAGSIAMAESALQWLIAGGIALLAMNFYLWPRTLTLLPLSLAAPLTNLSVVTVPLMAFWFLNETVTIRQWTGIGLILVGAVLVSSRGGKVIKCESQ